MCWRPDERRGVALLLLLDGEAGEIRATRKVPTGYETPVPVILIGIYGIGE